MNLEQTRIVNAFSIDVEDWFQVSAFENSIARNTWDSLPLRVERNVHALLELLDQRAVRATFFTLGWIAQRRPAMVRAIHDAGHEVASHGFGHQRVHTLTPGQFREDATRAKRLLEDVCGAAVAGYRAPSFSIGPSTPWAFDTLLEIGHTYSSSVYPVRHDLYGAPDAPRFAYRIRPELLEIPPTTVRMLGRNLPAAGGGFFRLLPYSLSRWTVGHVNRTDGRACVFYCHPWEIDPGQPRVTHASTRSRLRHYMNLERTFGRLERLLSDFGWNRIDRVFSAELARSAAAQPACA
jgi:polysaccharide deacetylase family protein (PEP-CTERM system associated)